MGRGARAAYRREEIANKAAIFGQVQQAIADIPEDYSPEEKAAIRRARLGGIDIGYGNLEEASTRQFGRTGSTAGLAEYQQELQRQRIREKSRAGAELEAGFAEVPVERARKKLQYLTPVHGQQTGSIANLFARQGPSTVDRIIGAGTAAAGAAAAACWIAEELYGLFDFRTVTLRLWLNEVFGATAFGSMWMWLYRRHGRSVARWIRFNRLGRRAFRFIFDRLFAIAQRDLSKGVKAWDTWTSSKIAA